MKKSVHDFPNTPSYIVGLAAAFGIDSVWLGRSDWWFWLVVLVAAVIYGVVQDVRQHPGRNIWTRCTAHQWEGPGPCPACQL